MKPPKKPTEHELWFVSTVRKKNDVQRLNKRQLKTLNKVHLWEKFNGPLEQKTWKF